MSVRSLRLMASRKPRVSHNWTGGLLWVLCAVLALGWLDALDDKEYITRTVERKHSSPTVRLVGDGYECRLSHIDRVWELVLLEKCKDLAATLKLAEVASK